MLGHSLEGKYKLLFSAIEIERLKKKDKFVGGQIRERERNKIDDRTNRYLLFAFKESKCDIDLEASPENQTLPL